VERRSLGVRVSELSVMPELASTTSSHKKRKRAGRVFGHTTTSVIDYAGCSARQCVSNATGKNASAL
jgi:hypothetical protein